MLDDPWLILTKIEESIKAKIEKYGTPLRDWKIDIFRGILTGNNDAFIIDEMTAKRLITEDPNSAEIIRPIIRGKNIGTNSIAFNNEYLIVSHNGYRDSYGKYNPQVNINDYPAVKNWFDSEIWNTKIEHISSYKRLVNRTDQGATPYNLRDTKYLDEFNKKKIVFSRISGDFPKFALDHNQYMLNDTAYLITGNNLEYLINQLTSAPIWFAFKRFYMGGGINNEFKVNNLQNLPVPLPNQKINFSVEEINFISSSLKW